MSLTRHILVAVCLLFLGAVTYAEDTCTSSRINSCLVPFVQHYGQQDGNTFVTTGEVDELTLDAMCRDFDAVKLCINDFAKSCDETSRKVFQGLYDMYAYVCGKGKQVFLRNQKCLATPALVTELTVCNKTASDKFQQISERLYYWRMEGYHTQEEVDEQKKKFCSTMDEFKHCLKRSVSKYCSSEARDYTVNVFNAMLKPAVSQVDCNGGLNFQVWYAVASAAGLVTTALIGWCVGMYIQSRRKQSRNQSTSYTDRSMLTTNEEYYDDPPLYRSQVQMQQAQMQPAPVHSTPEPAVEAMSLNMNPPPPVNV